MSALEFSRGRMARCIRNAVSRRDACVGSPGNEALILRGTSRALSSRPIPLEPFRTLLSLHEIFFWTLIFSRQKVARARIRSRRVLVLPRDFLLRQSVHVPLFNDLARVLLNFCLVFHLFSNLLSKCETRRACVFTASSYAGIDGAL